MAAGVLTAEGASQNPASVWSNPWVQLALGVICMITVANLQYGWPLFIKPIGEKFNWYRPAIDVSFTIFILLQTWLVPIEGWFVDKYGSRLMVVAGGALAGLGWMLNSFTDSLQMLYLAALVGGIGAGCVYGACVGNALKWFPTRRGLAVGLTAAGYGAGSALTVGPIGDMIAAQGFEHAFLSFGVAQGVIIMIAGSFLLKPSEEIAQHVPHLPGATLYNSRPMEVLREPTFWLMYLMFTLMVAAGLMATQQFGPIAKDAGITKEPVALLGMTLPWALLTITNNFGGRVVNGLTRPLFGWISDRYGRENTMCVAFLLEAVCILLMSVFSDSATAFMILALLIFLCWGEVYSLFPATCADSFGARHAATNAGMLYTAKGTANLLLPLGPMIISAFGGWTALLWFCAILSVISAVLAIVVLKPMRADLQQRHDDLLKIGKGR